MVAFERVCAIVLPLPDEKPVAVPLVRDAVQEYATVAPVVPVVSAMLVAVPAQMVWEDGVAITSEVGLTVTSKLKEVPGQVVGLGPVGVMTYLTTPGEVPVLSRV